MRGHAVAICTRILHMLISGLLFECSQELHRSLKTAAWLPVVTSGRCEDLWLAKHFRLKVIQSAWDDHQLAGVSQLM